VALSRNPAPGPVSSTLVCHDDHDMGIAAGHGSPGRCMPGLRLVLDHPLGHNALLPYLYYNLKSASEVPFFAGGPPTRPHTQLPHKLIYRIIPRECLRSLTFRFPRGPSGETRGRPLLQALTQDKPWMLGGRYPAIPQVLSSALLQNTLQCFTYLYTSASPP